MHCLEYSNSRYSFDATSSFHVVTVKLTSFIDINETNSGACIYLSKDIPLILSVLEFQNCYSLKSCGAVYAYGSSSSVSVVYCFFHRTSSFDGVAIFHLTFAHSQISMISVVESHSNAGHLAVVSESNLYECFSNYSNNEIEVCPSIYKEFSSELVVESNVIADCISESGAIIDANHATGKSLFKRVDCIRNRARNDLNGIIYMNNNLISVAFENMNIFGNTDFNYFYRFALMSNTIITMSNCNTDYPSPHPSFSITSLTTNAIIVDVHVNMFLSRNYSRKIDVVVLFLILNCQDSFYFHMEIFF